MRNTPSGSLRPSGLQSPQGRAPKMRFVFNDPHTVRGAVHEMAGAEPVATRERGVPIPVDVYQLPEDKPNVIEAVKGGGYREVARKNNQRKCRRK